MRPIAILLSILLRLAADPPRMTENSGDGCANTPAAGEEHRVVVGRIVDCDQMFFLAEESSLHAYILTDISRVKRLLGGKVLITGAFQSPHVLAIETEDELS